MTRKITKPPCLLLDSNVIIELHELGIWEEFIACCEVIVPGAIVNESQYYLDENEIKVEIDLKIQVEKGLIEEIDPSLEELKLLRKVFSKEFLKVIHAGEEEALALICAKRVEDYYFCTADAPAIKALAMIHKSDKGICLEEILELIGKQKRLTEQYKKEYFDRLLSRGSKNFVTGEGYSSPKIADILQSLDL